MAVKTEAAITKQVIKYLEGEGWFTWKIRGGPMQKAGMPDLLIARNGRVIWLEIKRENALLTPIQLHRIKELRGYGMTVYVVRDVQTAIEIDETLELRR